MATGWAHDSRFDAEVQRATTIRARRRRPVVPEGTGIVEPVTAVVAGEQEVRSGARADSAIHSGTSWSSR